MMDLYFTQMDPLDPRISELLADRGWVCRHLPMRRVVFSEEPFELDSDAWDALILTSKQAARWLLRKGFERLPPLAVVGESTSVLMGDATMLLPSPAPTDADALAALLRKRFQHKTARLLFLRGASSAPTLARELRHHKFQERIVYRTEKLSQKLPAPTMPAMVYFQAPSTVFDYQEIYHNPPTHTAAIGKSTAMALKQIGWRQDFQPSRPENACFAAELPAWSDWREP